MSSCRGQWTRCKLNGQINQTLIYTFNENSDYDSFNMCFGDVTLLIHSNCSSLLICKHYSWSHIPIFHCTYELHKSHSVLCMFMTSRCRFQLLCSAHLLPLYSSLLWCSFKGFPNPGSKHMERNALYRLWIPLRHLCIIGLYTFDVDKSGVFFWTCWPHLILLHVVHTRVEHRAQVSQVEYCQCTECYVNHIHPQRLHGERHVINISDIFNSFRFHCNTDGFLS